MLKFDATAHKRSEMRSRVVHQRSGRASSTTRITHAKNTAMSIWNMLHSSHKKTTAAIVHDKDGTGPAVFRIHLDLFSYFPFTFMLRADPQLIRDVGISLCCHSFVAKLVSQTFSLPTTDNRFDCAKSKQTELLPSIGHFQQSRVPNLDVPQHLSGFEVQRHNLLAAQARTSKTT